MKLLTFFKKNIINIIPTKKISINNAKKEKIDKFELYFFSTNPVLFLPNKNTFFKPLFLYNDVVVFTRYLVDMFRFHFLDFINFQNIKETPTFLNKNLRINIDCFFDIVSNLSKKDILFLYSNKFYFEKNNISLWHHSIESKLKNIYNKFFSKGKEYEIGVSFLWFLFHSFQNSKKTNSYRVRHRPITNSLATYSFAKLLDVDNLVVESKLSLYEEPGVLLFGCETKNCKGTRAKDVLMSQNVLTKNAEMDLYTLKCFDNICQQKDHGPNNYNLIINSNCVVGCCAFDNDYPFSFLFFKKEKHIDKIDINLLNKNFIHKICIINKKHLSKALKAFLLSSEISQLYKRIKYTKKIVKKNLAI